MERTGGAGYRVIGPDYFETLGIPVVAGRIFDAGGPPGELVTVINETMAEENWPGEDPIGKRVRAVSMDRGLAGEGAPWLTVIGVVGDTRHFGFDSDPEAEMYADFRRAPLFNAVMTVVVRGTDGALLENAGQLRQAIWGLDTRLAVEMSTMEERLKADLGTQRLVTGLLTLFGTLALALACLGVYGVLSFQVAQRRREIGVRGALGAQSSSIFGMVVRDALGIAGIGIVVGVTGAWFARGILASQVEVVSTGDPLAFTLASGILLLVAFLAAATPAWKALKVDPVEALRSQ